MIVCFSAGGCTHLPAPSTVERCVVIATRGCFVVVVFFPQVWRSQCAAARSLILRICTCSDLKCKSIGRINCRRIWSRSPGKTKGNVDVTALSQQVFYECPCRYVPIDDLKEQMAKKLFYTRGPKKVVDQPTMFAHHAAQTSLRQRAQAAPLVKFTLESNWGTNRG